LELAKGAGTLQSVVISANQQNLLNDDLTRKFLLLSIRLNMAGKEATAITRGLNTLTLDNRRDLLAIFRPVLAELNTAATADGLGITDPQTRQQIQLTLAGLQTLVNSLQITLAVR
jgi:hypothetical protein